MERGRTRGFYYIYVSKQKTICSKCNFFANAERCPTDQDTIYSF